MSAPSLLLRDLRWWSAGTVRRGDLRIAGGRFSSLGDRLQPRRGDRVLELDGWLGLPGLVNAHDHLGLDLLPHLGDPPYRSFYDWAEEIYHPDEPPVADVLRVPLPLRLRWGGLRNLVSGVTTVVHHDPYHGRLSRRLPWRRFPIRVLRRYGWAHSLGFEPKLTARHRRSRFGGPTPFILHAAEGIDERAAAELDRLEKLDVLRPWTVLVHGIAVTPPQIELMARRRVSLVWCPGSNLHLYDRTAPIAALRGRVPLSLGTDSTLSGPPTLLDELRTAHGTGLATASVLLQMVTANAAAIFGLRGRGIIETGSVADLVVLPDGGADPAASLLAARAEQVALVLVGGQVQLAEENLAAELGLGTPNLTVGGAGKWVRERPAELKRRIHRAGGEVLDSSALWQWLQTP